MSDSSGSLNVPPRVLTTIGARDLYQLGTRKSGFLRKQGNIERRLSQLGKVAEQFKWRQKFVIVAKGCIYVYDNEDSTSPKTAFSLLGYNRILRFETSKTFAKNAFRIEMPLTESVRYRTFSAHSDEERKEWMCAIYEEMMHANKRVCPSALQSYEYHELEVPIFTVSDVKRSIKAIDSEIVDDSDDYDNGDYDTIDEIKVVHPKFTESQLKRKELPPIPKELPWSKNDEEHLKKSQSLPSPVSPIYQKTEIPHLYLNENSNKKPPVAPKPKKQNILTSELEDYEDAAPLSKKKIFSPGDYEFDSTDTASAISYLKGQPKGTFLVRPSKTDKTKVLMVVDDKEEIKQYKIHQIESKFTLDQKMMFLSISEVMEYYRTCNVPNTTTKLTEGYGYK